MEHTTLSNLIDTLEYGTKLHICVSFLSNCGNRKTRCTHSQSVHDRPVCLAVKKDPQGLVSCYRCRNIVQKAVVRYRRPIAGLCANGVYEYCRPVIYEERPVCVIFVGNVLTDDPVQRRKLTDRVYRETGVILTGVGVYSRNTDAKAERIRRDIEKIVMAHEWALQMHGFYIDEERKIIRFDVVMSFDVSHSEGVRTICEEVKEIYPEYDLVIVPDIDITD